MLRHFIKVTNHDLFLKIYVWTNRLGVESQSQTQNWMKVEKSLFIWFKQIRDDKLNWMDLSDVSSSWKSDWALRENGQNYLFKLCFISTIKQNGNNNLHFFFKVLPIVSAYLQLTVKGNKLNWVIGNDKLCLTDALPVLAHMLNFSSCLQLQHPTNPCSSYRKCYTQAQSLQPA